MDLKSSSRSVRPISKQCLHNTDGPRCDNCKPGYYGNPASGGAQACQPCPCPGTASSNQWVHVWHGFLLPLLNKNNNKYFQRALKLKEMTLLLQQVFPNLLSGLWRSANLWQLPSRIHRPPLWTVRSAPGLSFIPFFLFLLLTFPHCPPLKGWVDTAQCLGGVSSRAGTGLAPAMFSSRGEWSQHVCSRVVHLSCFSEAGLCQRWNGPGGWRLNFVLLFPTWWNVVEQN